MFFTPLSASLEQNMSGPAPPSSDFYSFFCDLPPPPSPAWQAQAYPSEGLWRCEPPSPVWGNSDAPVGTPFLRKTTRRSYRNVMSISFSNRMQPFLSGTFQNWFFTRISLYRITLARCEIPLQNRLGRRLYQEEIKMCHDKVLRLLCLD